MISWIIATFVICRSGLGARHYHTCVDISMMLFSVMMKFVVFLVQMAMIEIQRIYHSAIVPESVVVLLQ